MIDEERKRKGGISRKDCLSARRGEENRKEEEERGILQKEGKKKRS